MEEWAVQRAEGCGWEAGREEMGNAGISWEGWTPQRPTHSRSPPCPPAAAPLWGGSEYFLGSPVDLAIGPLIPPNLPQAL